MPAIDQVAVQAFIDAGNVATTAAAKGKALEDLICLVFAQVPGISITRRNQLNAFSNEEVDVAFFNDQAADGLPFLPEILLVEAKNWSKAVGSAEVGWFDTKVRNRGLNFGVLVATLGVTGNAGDLTAAHHTIAMALHEKRRLIVLTVAEIQALADTGGLVALIKTKLCDLAINGTIV